MLQDLKKGPLKNGTKLRGQGGDKERRAEPRYSVAAMAEAIEIKSHTRVVGRISDIGAGGCYFEVMSPFAVGSELKLRITRNEQTLTASARVLYSTGGMGMGLLFTAIDPDQQHLLQRWVGELSGKGVAPIPEAAGGEASHAGAGGAPGGPETTHEVQHEPARAAEAGSTNDEQRNVLNELIISLMRKRVLTDTEGKALLRKLMS